METGYPSMMFAGESAVGDDYSPALNADGLSFQELVSYEKPLLSSLEFPYGSSSTMDFPAKTTYGFYNGNYQSKEMVEACTTDYDGDSLRKVEAKLKMPKAEPSTEPFNFIPTSSDLVSSVFSQLPELQSLEHVSHEEKRFKSSFSPFGATMNPYVLQAMFMRNFHLMANYFAPAPPQQVQPTPPPKLAQRELARRRRNTMSEKARSLQKVLPWDKKMDMATMYEETYKYIKFLQAQIAVLESMPVTTTPIASSSSSNLASSPSYHGDAFFGELGKLNRQQLLEIVVNSPVAQTVLYSKGCCIYSLEQLVMLKEIAEKNFFIFNHSTFC